MPRTCHANAYDADDLAVESRFTEFWCLYRDCAHDENIPYMKLTMIILGNKLEWEQHTACTPFYWKSGDLSEYFI